jgi:sigma-E factor negative regulatory protein RseB
VWRVIDPPDGFRTSDDSTLGADHRIYSDGIASVSIYVEPLSRTAPAFSGPFSRGAVHFYGRVLDGMQVTVLGDVPAATVERFAQSVALGAADAGGG